MGGGFIAIELVSSFLKNNLKTTLLVREPYFFPRFLSPEEGHLAAEVLKKNGIEVILEDEIQALENSSKVEKVITKEGRTINCQLLGVGVGIRPSLRFLDQTPIRHDPFIEVDNNFQTNTEGVWAAGDVTFFPNPLLENKRINLQNWANAADQGRLAGAAMTGSTQEGKLPLSMSYSINFFTSSISVIGVTNANLADLVITRGSKEKGRLGRLFKKENKIIGATLVGLPQDRVSIMKLLAKDIGTSYDENMSSLEFDLKEVTPVE